jgi:hypothetical protein
MTGHSLYTPGGSDGFFFPTQATAPGGFHRAAVSLHQSELARRLPGEPILNLFSQQLWRLVDSLLIAVRLEIIVLLQIGRH